MQKLQNNDEAEFGFTWYENNIKKVKVKDWFSDGLREWRTMKLPTSIHDDYLYE